MDTDPEVLPEAIEYFRYYFLGAIAVVLYNICTGIMNALGDSRRPLIYLIISSMTNVVLDLLFVGGFGWGVWSAAFATTVSQAVSCVLCLYHLTRKGHIYSVSFRKIRFHWETLKQILRYGLRRPKLRHRPRQCIRTDSDKFLRQVCHRRFRLAVEDRGLCFHTYRELQHGADHIYRPESRC